MTCTPADPPIACAALQCSSGEGNKGDLVIAPQCDIPKSLADFRQIAQVMMLTHQLLIAPLFPPRYRLNSNIMQIQTGSLHRWS